MSRIPITTISWLPLLMLALAAGAAETAVGHACAIGDYRQGKVFIVDREGRVTWEHPAPSVCDLSVLANGNLLFTTHHGVLEVTRAKEVAFRYQTDSEVFSCQRLPDGTTLVAETTHGRLALVDAVGKVLRTVPLLQPGEKGSHGYIANVRQLPDGHFLVAMYEGREIRTYDGEGRLLKQWPAAGGGRAVVRLADGRTLFSTADRSKDAHVTEIAEDGTVLWDVSNGDLPDRPLQFICGLHRLPNGNTLVANYLGHGPLGRAPHLLEITPDKRVVWTWADHGLAKAVTCVQVLDAGVTSDLR